MKLYVTKFVLCCFLLGTTAAAFAAFSGDGTGVLGDPYIITNASQLNEVRNDLAAYYKLANDIDLTDYLASGGAGYTDGAGWIPIDTLGTAFSGEFDGDRHTISGLWMNRPTAGCATGLFCENDGTIKNLNVSISEEGIIGGSIGNGGLAGINAGFIVQCSVSGSVSGYAPIGGLVGADIGGSIMQCYASGSVESTFGYDTGGLVGMLSNSGSITDCYATNSVKGPDWIGGLVGTNDGSTIKNCYATGSVIATDASGTPGALVGGGSSSAENCFFDTETTGLSEGFGQGISTGMTGETTEVMKTQATFTDPSVNWNFVGTWFMLEGVTYPLFQWQIGEMFCGGNGTPDNPYLICTPLQLDLVRKVLDASYQLANDIDLAGYLAPGGDGYAQWGDAGWDPIGYGTDETTHFMGHFNGAGHIITNLKINRPTTDNVGLFGYIQSATIDSVGIENADITGQNIVGGVVGKNEGGAVSICYVTGSVSGIDDEVGGVVGENDGSVTNCYNSSAVSGRSYVGGVVGSNNLPHTVTNCYNNGTVSGFVVGGVVGINNSGTVSNCFYDKDICVDIDAIGGVSPDVAGQAEGETTELMKTQTTFTTAPANWDFTDIWIMQDKTTYPLFRWQFLPFNYGLIFDVPTHEFYFDINGNQALDAATDIVYTDQTGKWSFSNDTLYLNNFTWETFAPIALTITGGDANINIEGVNTFTSDCDNGTASQTAGIFSGYAQTFSGGGVLNATGGTLSTSANYGILNNGITLKGGTVTAQGNMQALKLSGGALTLPAAYTYWTNTTTTVDPGGAGLTFPPDAAYSYNANDKFVKIETLPVLEGVVSITGTAVYGATLTADISGITSAAPLGTLSYQWKRGGTAITAATNSSYDITTDDIGQTITVEVLAANYAIGLTSAGVEANKANTTTTVTSNGSSSYGQNVILDASVTAVAPGSGVPTGTVTFYAKLPPAAGGTQAVSSAITLTNGSASFEVQGLTVSSLTIGSNLFYAVYSGDPDFITSTSADVSQTVNKATPTITEPVTLTATYGQTLQDISAQLTAVAAPISGAFTWETADPSSNMVGTVTASPNTTYTLKFTPANETNYNAVSGITTSITVNPKNITVTALGGSSTYGDSPADPGISASGLVNGETESVLTGLSNSFGITAASPANAYKLTVAGALTNANYTVTTTTAGSWTVNPKGITVTALGGNSIYGDSPADPGISASGLVNNETESELTGLSNSFGITAASPANAYKLIVAGTLTNANYTVTTANSGTWTVNPKGITVTALGGNSTYGDSPADPGISASGLVNGETESELTGLSNSFGITAASPANAYKLTVAGALTNVNYTVTTTTAGTWTVNPKGITVTALGGSSIYGDSPANPGLSVSGLVNNETESELTGLSNSFGITAASPANTYKLTVAGALTNANYTVTATNDGTWTVNPKNITVTALGGSSTYGDSPANPGLSVSGLVNNETESELTGLSNSFGIIAASPANTYKLTVAGTLTNANYTVTATNAGTWTVNPKDITVTANSGKSTYGDSPTNPGFSVSGLVNGETESVLTGLSVGFGITAASPANTYKLTVAGTLTNANYTVTATNDGTWTVNPKGITVTVNSGSSTYGDTPVDPGFSVSGLINGETKSILTGLNDNFGITATSPANTYKLTVSGALTNANYTVTTINAGTWTVNPKGITVTALGGSSTYGDNPTNPGFSVSGLVNSETESVLTGLSNSFGITAASPANTYKLTVAGTLTNTNYTISSKIDGTWIVGKRPITITAADETIDYGQTPELKTTITSGNLVNGDVLTGTLAVNNFNVGTHNITQGSLTAGGSYNITFVPGTLTILSVDVSIKEIDVNGNPAQGSDLNYAYNVDCGEDMATVFVSADPNATVTIDGVAENPHSVSLPKYGDNEIKITITAQNGDSETYTLALNKPVPFNQLVTTRWDNTMTVINNPANNGGYNFTSYKWFRNGEEIGSDQSFSAGKNGEKLDPSDVYSVEATAEGVSGIIRSCESNVALQSAFLIAYPNPVSKGNMLYVQINADDDILKDAVIEIYNESGALMRQVKVEGTLTPIDINYTSGNYVFLLKGKDGLKKDVKVIVK